ncbi:MAG: FAD-dependent oxidoreductase [Thermoleophilaceae bacterium]
MASEPETPLLRADVAVVGAGAAGIFAALVAAREGARVALVSRRPLDQSASYWAQGGIAAALAHDDSVAEHLADTMAAGRGLGRASAARVLCEESPERVRDLQRLGVRFDGDRRGGGLALGLEGGHSTRRVVHAGGSATGRRITRQLSALAATHERITVLEWTTAGAIWTSEGRCVGLRGDTRDGDSVLVLSRGTILATGGAAALWARTTNPRGAIGAGITLAHAAGAELADLEFQQFHPTALVHDGDRDGFLITEAIRGEGATLVNPAGERFVDELAPRDEVALAVQRESAAGPVHLDMREVDPGSFPNIAQALAEVGLDSRRELIPVAPAAHYTMGGIATDLEGRSSIPGLHAIGECACNGLHGANRLASNSLADCFVFGRRAALAAAAGPAPQPVVPEPPPPGPNPVPVPATREALWRHGGLERSPEGLVELAEDPFPLAALIARCALAREESRGAHRRTDHPTAQPQLAGAHSLVDAAGEHRFESWD